MTAATAAPVTAVTGQRDGGSSELTIAGTFDANSYSASRTALAAAVGSGTMQRRRRRGFGGTGISISCREPRRISSMAWSSPPALSAETERTAVMRRRHGHDRHRGRADRRRSPRGGGAGVRRERQRRERRKLQCRHSEHQHHRIGDGGKRVHRGSGRRGYRLSLWRRNDRGGNAVGGSASFNVDGGSATVTGEADMLAGALGGTGSRARRERRPAARSASQASTAATSPPPRSTRVRSAMSARDRSPRRQWRHDGPRRPDA